MCHHKAEHIADANSQLASSLNLPAIADLRSSEVALNAIFDASPDALVISNAEGEIVMASHQIEKILGYSSGEVVGKSIEMFIPESFRCAHSRLRNTFFSVPVTRLMGQHREIKALRKDGSTCDVEIGLSQIVTERGAFVASSIRDISDRKRIDDSLRVHEEKLRHLFELSPLGIVMTDVKGRFLEFNESFQRITGYSPEELKALDHRALTPQKYDAEQAHQLTELMRTGRYGPFEKEYRRKDGSLVPMRLNGALVTAQDGSLYVWSIAEDISSRKKAEEKIRELAYFDQLTGLPNRRLMLDRLQQAIAASERTGMYGCVLLIDLDNFKVINDTRGHETGDAFLKEVARKLQGAARPDDTISRLGGDEFIFILNNLGGDATAAAAAANLMAEKILAMLCRRISFGEENYQGSASIGAALFDHATASSDDLLKQVDMALYRAKAAGRGVVRFFDPAMGLAVMARSMLENDLRDAIDKKQFLLYYQAQVGGSGRITGAEVLLRWQHPEKGLIQPGEFIALAEETGLIFPLGQWVIDTAFSQLASWSTRPVMDQLTLSINVSVRQFNHPDFVDQVVRALDSSEVNPYRIKLEVTESALANDVNEIAKKMSVLKAKGVSFSLDDFGTGYSSLSFLKRLPLNQLKIDKSFVDDILIDANDAAIAKTVADLAHNLGLEVIAEGVEDKAQQDLLAAVGCYAYQGYLFSKPVALAEFEQLVVRQSGCTVGNDAKTG